MDRHAFAAKINSGMVLEFRKNLGIYWPDIKSFCDKYNLENLSIWSVDKMVFGYCEGDVNDSLKNAFMETYLNLKKPFESACEWISCERLPLMFHNYGDGRQNPELSYKRVFVAHLNEGCMEEYKLRHDRILRSPEEEYKHNVNNNFTIWYANDYIFGYSEVDSTLEREKSPEGLERSKAWETKMLEIMSWETNDVDWLTGEYHPNCNCIAKYK